MNAIHALCSAPDVKCKKYTMKNFELLTMILSALTWKKYNGQIKLVADEKVIDYIDKNNLRSIWNDIEKLEIPDNINHKTFWAAGKIYALKQQKSPCAIIDTDFIAWRNLDEYMNEELVVAHRESLKRNSCYPDISYFKMKEKYKFNKSYSFEVDPCNTAFLYINDMVFKDFYISESINFMRNSLESENDVCNMVYAEQRLLAMCAEQWNVNITALMEEQNIFSQHYFTHIWGYKSTLDKDLVKQEQFCRQCIKRIKGDYSEILPILEKILNIEAYL